MTDHPIVDSATWLAARTALLAEEKALTRRRDALAARRRALPWTRVEADYRFDGPQGPATLADLFDGRRQLIVFHFMFGPGWQAGCPSCSFWADQFDRAAIHLGHRDTSMVAVSRAPLAALEAYRGRMGWTFAWYSSGRSDFNRDFHVAFTEAEIAAGAVLYNYATQPFPVTEAPGISVFFRDDDGAVYYTYSCYGRGLDALNGAYHYLDLTPMGRDEAGLPYPMAWLRRHDEYNENG